MMKWCVVNLRYGLIFKEAGYMYYLILKMLQNFDKLAALQYCQQCGKKMIPGNPTEGGREFDYKEGEQTCQRTSED